MTRTSMFVAVFLAAVMLGVPGVFVDHDAQGPVGEAAAVAGDRTLRMGWPAFQDDIQTLNPLVYTMGAEYMLIWPCYSFVLTRNVNDEVIGDLAVKWDSTPDGRNWTIEIVKTAKWFDKLAYAIDPNSLHPVTVNDIKFTFLLIQNTDDNYLQYFFPEIPGTGGRLIEDITIVSDWVMTIKLRATYAPFISALTTIPILPEYIWSTRDWDWRNYDDTYPPIVGSGMWYYGLDKQPDKLYATLERSPTWFGTEEYGWQSHVNTLYISSESEDTNIASYKDGALDVMTGVTPAQFHDPTLPGDTWGSSQGFVFEFNMNQMSDELRTELGGLYMTGDNDQLLLNPTIKLALQMSIDKEGFVAEALQYTGKAADSLMPEVSPWYYDYGGPTAPPGETEIPFNTAAAREMLYDNGWRYRMDGSEILAGAGDYWTYYPLSKAVGGVATDTLQFRYITPNTDTYFMTGAQCIQMTARETGVDLQYSAEPMSTMNNAWYAADYDSWLWDWWFVPNSEPSVDVMEVLATEAIGSWSDVYWTNATYDAIYYESLSEMNATKRQELLNELQRMAYLYSGCFPVAWMDLLYATQSVAPDYWQNYGDWTSNYIVTVDSGYPWLFTQLYPLDNPAPMIEGWVYEKPGDTEHAISFTGITVTDAGPPTLLEYRWNFGDGTKSGWLANPETTHLYPEDGYYEAWMMVREAGTADGYISSKKVEVTVIDISNTAPHGLYFTKEPSDPDSGTLVYLNGTATDDQGDPMEFTWDFGDGETAFGQQVTHQFDSGLPLYTITMFVDDGHLGLEDRPARYSDGLAVSENRPPTVVAFDATSVMPRAVKDFEVDASDPDSRDVLRFTWNWGDGTELTVTSEPLASHSYKLPGTYTLTIYCDDMTGLAGHNVSDTALVYVSSPSNKAPTISYFTVSNDMPYTEEMVTFTGLALDDNDDLLRFTFVFGDGTTYSTIQEAANTAVSVDHSYAVSDFYLAYLIVWDFQADPVYSTEIGIEVQQGNQAPVVDPLAQLVATVGFEETFSASATDIDGDTLKYTWDFGDGSDLVVGNPVTHIYAVSSGEYGMLYTVHVDDGQGHNVTANGIIRINWQPWIEEPLEPVFVVGGATETYSIVASDNDSDPLVVTWDFGDGTVMVGASVDYAYAVVGVETEFTLTVYVEDDFDDPDVSHNVSSSTTVTVMTEPDLVPPVAEAGPDIPAMAGEEVTFDGSGSTDDVGIVSWVWTFTHQGYPEQVEGEIAVFTFLEPDVDVTVTLTVTDAGGNSDTDEMIVHVGGWIPELPTLAFPVIGTIALIGVLLAVRRRKDL